MAGEVFAGRLEAAGDAITVTGNWSFGDELACAVAVAQGGDLLVATRDSLVAVRPDGVVVWTRGRGDTGPDPSDDVRACFARNGFREVAFTRPADARFRVGVHRLATAPPPAHTLAGERLFSFAG